MAAMTSFFYNTRTGMVEELEKRGQAKDLLGPYATRAEAEQALSSAARRTEEWDREERQWRDED
jgi:hypothetical protein